MHDSPPVVPFAFFVSLFRELSKITPHKASSLETRQHSASRKTFTRWVAQLHRLYDPLPLGTTAIIFHLLFPEEDCRRKYDLQETRLARHLCDAFGISDKGRGSYLYHWKMDGGSGCLGSEVEVVLSPVLTEVYGDEQMSLYRINSLLCELAALSPFSHADIRAACPKDHRRTRIAILRDLFNVSAIEASFLCQIILKDLRPLLYPLASTHYTAALKEYKSNAVSMLTKEQAMQIWDPTGRMLRAYKMSSSLEGAAEAFEAGSVDVLPLVGIPIQIPKCIKGQGCVHALQQFKHAKKVWAETKYDGERAQIHVKVHGDRTSHITIFSKSGRDSTLDRAGVHWIVRDALGLPQRGRIHAQPADVAQAHDPNAINIVTDVVLEAEMVAFSDAMERIDEFWRIRSLVEGSAMGFRGFRHTGGYPAAARDNTKDVFSQCSLVSNGTDDGTRHLALVFFDVLLFNSKSLLRTPYSRRRHILESLITPNPGHAMLAERTAIPMGAVVSKTESEDALRAAFATLIADHQEGAVLKADDGQYNDWSSPWVKLKKDYIPGHGDTLDLVLVAAGWDKDRARELRVSPSTYTTFYLGALSNSEEFKSDDNGRPHFEVWFTASYGLSRDQLEELNFMIRSLNPVPYRQPSKHGFDAGSYTFSLFSGVSSPAVVLDSPLLVEVFGAGFTKAAKCKHYELRFPRLTKVFRPSERSWADGVSVSALHIIAREAVGRDRTHKDVDDCVKQMWSKPTSPSVKSVERKRVREDTWRSRLEDSDGVPAAKRRRPQEEQPLGPTQTRKMQPASSSMHVNLSMGQPVVMLGADESKQATPGKRRPNHGLASRALGSVTNFTDTSPSNSQATTARRRSLSSSYGSATPFIVEAIPRLTLEPVEVSRVDFQSMQEDATTVDGLAHPSSTHPFPRSGTTPSNIPDAGRPQIGNTHRFSQELTISNARVSTASATPQLRPSPARSTSLGLDPNEARSEAPHERGAFTSPAKTSHGPERSSSPAMHRPTAPNTLVDYTASPLYHFLNHSIIYFAKPTDPHRPAGRPSLKSVLPPARRAHGLDAFLIGCGWTEDATRPMGMVEGVVRGVIFVDKDEPEQRADVMRLVEDRAKRLVDGGFAREGRVPIFGMDVRLLSYESLQAGFKGVDFLEEALFGVEISDVV